jgi:hypothetical protein
VVPSDAGRVALLRSLLDLRDAKSQEHVKTLLLQVSGSLCPVLGIESFAVSSCLCCASLRLHWRGCLGRLRGCLCVLVAGAFCPASRVLRFSHQRLVHVADLAF